MTGIVLGVLGGAALMLFLLVMAGKHRIGEKVKSAHLSRLIEIAERDDGELEALVEQRPADEHCTLMALREYKQATGCPSASDLGYFVGVRNLNIATYLRSKEIEGNRVL